MSSSVRNRRGSISSSSLPPRVLNVQKFAEARAADLEALHTIISNRNEDNFRLPRCKRRRTSSHDGRIARNKHCRKKPRLSHDQAAETKEEKKKKKKNPPRRVRRRMLFCKNMEFGFTAAGDGTERLRTHIWHAKRFTMIKRWGFYLPLGVHGRGRGSRALLKRLKSGALLHDSSYCSVIQLAGREDSILAILRKVLVQPRLNISERNSQLVFHGMCHQSAMLQHFGVPLSKLICPITYMWRPVERHADVNIDISSSFRQMWVWVHASAFNEAFHVLSAASKEQTSNDGAPVSCLSLKGKLGKVELIGSEATQIIQKIIISASETKKESRPCESMEHLSMILKRAETIPPGAVISLHVVDPRDLPSKEEKENAVLSTCDDLVHSEVLKEEGFKEPSDPTPASPKLKGENVISLWSDPSQNAVFVSDNKALWDSHAQLIPPIDDYTLCQEKHQKRLKLFHMDDENPVMLASERQERGSRTCPVLLLKHSFQNPSVHGWSIVLPLSWVKPFWVPLVSHGACAIGLREKRWVASEGRIPCFPFDFPDCEAYITLMSDVAAEVDQMAERRPPSARPTKIPIPPPWDCIKSSISKLQEVFQRSKVQGDDQLNNGKLSHLNSTVDLIISDQSTGPLFCLGSVVRSDEVLHYCLKHSSGGHLLLFPESKLGERAFSDLIESERMRWTPRSGDRLFADRPLLFSRVFLRPSREGAFEEGAVVCAPLFSDILSLSSRREERETLQISQSTVDSYFLQLESGRWAMQVPSDPSHRWPIGFITSGSTRGSVHPTAMAVCEVTLLAQLREQQWSEMQEKSRPEVLVLVRNPRSTAYRLCRASIVLEHGHDFDFM